MEYLIRTEFFIHFGGALVLAILLSYFLKVFKLPLQLRLPIAFFAVLALGYGYELLQGKAADTGTDILADLAGAAIGILAWALIEKKFNILPVIVFIILLSCDEAPAQEEFYEISWDLNKDGITYEYLLFVGVDSDPAAIPFNDSLFTFPDSQWAQFLIGSFNHDSMEVVDPDRGIVEYNIQVDPEGNHETLYFGVALFAKSPSGFYSNRSVVDPFIIQAFIRPGQINQAGIFVERKTRWK